MTLFRKTLPVLVILAVLMLTGCDIKASSVFEEDAVDIDVSLADGLEYSFRPVEVTDEMVAGIVFSEATKGQVNSEPVTGRGAEVGDTVTIDFSAAIDGQPVPGGEGSDVRVVLGTGELYRGFEMALVGVRAGEDFDFTVDYPADYDDLQVAGSSVTFTGHVNSLTIVDDYIIDDDFIREHTDYTSLAAYSEYWRGRLGDRFEKENYAEAVRGAVKALAEKAYPGGSGMTETEECEKVLASVAVKLGLTVSEKEISSAATEYSLKFGYSNTKAMEDAFEEAGYDLRKLITRRLLLERAAQYVFEHAKNVEG